MVGFAHMTEAFVCPALQIWESRFLTGSPVCASPAVSLRSVNITPPCLFRSKKGEWGKEGIKRGGFRENYCYRCSNRKGKDSVQKHTHKRNQIKTDYMKFLIYVMPT